MKFRRYDGYIATPEALPIGRVLFIGKLGVVVKERMTRESWEAERALPSRFGMPPRRGSVVADDVPCEEPTYDNAAAPPAELAEAGNFYGVNCTDAALRAMLDRASRGALRV